MAFNIKDIIFDFFGVRDKVKDLYKDVNGNGFKQRFIELMANDVDENEISNINNLVENTGDPRTALVKFLPYREQTFGGLVDLLGGVALQRKVIEHASFIHKRRSTKDGYEILLRWRGFDTAIVTNLAGNSGFDSPVTFDDPVRVFDQKCATCGRYSIALTGSITIDPDVVQAILNIIKFNQPIDMKISTITYNGTPILSGFMVTFFVDANGDLQYTNPYDASFSAQLINGDLVITSDFAQFYSLDINGDVIFTT